MDFNEYQEKAQKTALGLAETTLWYPALGLAGEAGEVAEKIKKRYRDQARDTTAIIRELGDVLWYLSQLATNLNIALDTVATANLEKLADRHNRGTIQGSGDTR